MSDSLKSSPTEVHLGIIGLLIRLGADVARENENGVTPLMAAVGRNDCNAVRLLIAGGADLNQTTRLGSALHHAVSLASSQTVKLLLQLGADVGARDLAGDTPLHRAMRLGNLEALDLLLKSGACLDSENRERLTPLDVAVVSGRLDVFEYLRAEKGLRFSPDETKCMKLLALAVETKNETLALWLLNNQPAMRRSNSTASKLCLSGCLSLSLGLCLSFILF